MCSKRAKDRLFLEEKKRKRIERKKYKVIIIN